MTSTDDTTSIESLINGAESLAEYLNEEMGTDIGGPDILDALASLGLTIITDPSETPSIAYATSLTRKEWA